MRPRGARPPRAAVIAAGAVTVARMVTAPPSAFSSSATSTAVESSSGARRGLSRPLPSPHRGRSRPSRSHVPCELQPEVPEAANSEDRDQIAGSRAALAQRVERRDAGAEQRCGVGSVQVVRDRGECAARDDHVIRVAAVVGDARHLAVLARDQIPATAGLAVAAVAAEPADAYALPGLPVVHALANRLDPAGNLVSRHARVFETRVPALDRECIEWQTPQASTRTRTSPRPGSRSSRSISSSPAPGPLTCTARVVLMRDRRYGVRTRHRAAALGTAVRLRSRASPRGWRTSRGRARRACG